MEAPDLFWRPALLLTALLLTGSATAEPASPFHSPAEPAAAASAPAAAAAAALQDASRASSSPGRLIFRMADQMLPVAKYEVANGTVVRRADWPTLLMAKMPTSNPDKPATCTGSLVGPNVVLMAAHCIDHWTGVQRRAQLLVFGQLLNLTCEMHPYYYAKGSNKIANRPRGSYDYALCLLENSRAAATYFSRLRYEVIETEAQLEKADQVLMMGYGCRKVRVSHLGTLDWDFSDNELSVGDARIDSPAFSWLSEPAYLTVRSDPLKDPGLCPGDSGGPLFTGVTSKYASGQRRITGVNSRICSQLAGDYSAACATKPMPGNWTVVSSISATSVPEFATWARNWLYRQESVGLLICGVTRDAGDAPCRP